MGTKLDGIVLSTVSAIAGLFLNRVEICRQRRHPEVGNKIHTRDYGFGCWKIDACYKPMIVVFMIGPSRFAIFSKKWRAVHMSKMQRLSASTMEHSGRCRGG